MSAEKPKILIVGIVLKTYGGHTRFVEDLLNSGLPFRFSLFDPQRPPKDLSKPHRPGYQEIFDAGIGRAVVGVAITLYHFLIFPFVLLRERPDVVHFAGGGFWRFWEYTLYIQMCRLFRVKTIYHWLANFDDYYNVSSQRSRLLITRILAQIDRHIVLSQLDKDCLDKLISKDNVCFLPGGVSSEFLSQLDGPVPTRSTDETRILFIGGREPFRKGIFDVLKAYTIVVRRCPNTRLILTGGTNVEEAVKQTATTEINDHISLMGYVSESQKVDLYKSSDMLLLPSIHEGLPYVILEAMAAGLPVITTPVGGIPDVVEENVNGFLIQPGDVEALAKRIQAFCQDTALQAKMGQANREKIKMSYSEEAIFQSLRRIYDELCSQTTSHRSIG